MQDSNISAHFTLTEVTASETAQRKGISNDLPQALFAKAQALADHVLEAIRSQFGIAFSPLSWYRSPRLNRKVGGSKNSQHKQAEAADIRLPAKHISNLRLARWIRDNLHFDQLILEFYDPDNSKKGWVHCSYSLNKNRKQCLTAFSLRGLLGKRKTIYAPGLLAQLPRRYQRTFAEKRKLKKRRRV